MAKYADVPINLFSSIEVPSNVLRANRADQLRILTGAEEVGRGELVEGLTGLTEQGNRVAGGIQSGNIRLNVLGDELFEKSWTKLYQQAGAAPQAFQAGNSIYVRRSSQNLLSDIVHEGTHVLDEAGFLVKVPYSTNPYTWEKRAYFYERQFQRAGGGRVEFSTIDAMLQHIYRNY